MAIDLSKATVEELMAIHNEVLRNIAVQTKLDAQKPDLVAAGHDSHGSNHSNNKITDFQNQVADIFQRRIRTP